MKQSQFFTSAKAAEGLRLNLPGPDGKPTEAWFDVYGADGPVMQRAFTVFRRAGRTFIEEHGEAVRGTPAMDEFSEDQLRRLRATMVKAWSFDEPCTVESTMEFLSRAPYIAEVLDLFSSKREQFAEA